MPNYLKNESIKIVNESNYILGVRVDTVLEQNLVEHLENMVKATSSQYIVPLNPEMVMKAQVDNDFREAINSASLVLPDGMGIIWASRLLNKNILKRITGIDTVKIIAAFAELHQLKIFFLGAAEGIAKLAATRLNVEFPRLQIVGTFAGSPHPNDEKEICDLISASNADILLVAYGAPKQELWLARNLRHCNVQIAMCVGGTFDFLAGVTKRAPLWMQNNGLEWLYRLIQQPWRWRRMLALPRFAFKIIFERLFYSRLKRQFITL